MPLKGSCWRRLRHRHALRSGLDRSVEADWRGQDCYRRHFTRCLSSCKTTPIQQQQVGGARYLARLRLPVRSTVVEVASATKKQQQQDGSGANNNCTNTDDACYTDYYYSERLAGWEHELNAKKLLERCMESDQSSDYEWILVEQLRALMKLWTDELKAATSRMQQQAQAANSASSSSFTIRKRQRDE
jgi:hypothetical protein